MTEQVRVETLRRKFEEITSSDAFKNGDLQVGADCADMAMLYANASGKFVNINSLRHELAIDLIKADSLEDTADKRYKIISEGSLIPNGEGSVTILIEMEDGRNFSTGGTFKNGDKMRRVITDSENLIMRCVPDGKPTTAKDIAEKIQQYVKQPNSDLLAELMFCGGQIDSRYINKSVDTQTRLMELILAELQRLNDATLSASEKLDARLKAIENKK